MTKWLPIESAPKDGSIIRVRHRTLAPYHVYWRDGFWLSIEYMGGDRPTHWAPTRPMEDVR